MSAPINLRSGTQYAPLNPRALVGLSPFVGADLVSVPHGSAFGILARLIRLNALVPADLAPLLGIRTQRAQNLSSLMAFSDARQMQLAQALRLPDVPSSWNVSTWFPFSAPSKLMAGAWGFRYCAECLRGGYHTLLHQMPWFGRCPWHGEPLRTDCGQCGTAPVVSADWLPEQHLVCQCGHALIDPRIAVARATTPPAGAQPFLDSYLGWAACERNATTLVAPPAPDDPRRALARLVRLPDPWQPFAATPDAMHLRQWKATGRPVESALQTLRELEVLRRDRPGFVRLSAAHTVACARVAADLALKLPAQTLADGEMSLFLAGAGIEAPASFEPAKRPFSAEMSAMTPWRTSAGAFLNLTCLHPAAYRPVVQIMDAGMSGRPLPDFHSQSTPGELELLLRVSGHLLARGYAEGLRSLLATYVPALFGMERDAPHLTQPWLIVRRKGACVDQIRAVWEPIRVGVRREAEVIQEADDANRRRERYGGGRQKSKFKSKG